MIIGSGAFARTHGFLVESPARHHKTVVTVGSTLKVSKDITTCGLTDVIIIINMWLNAHS